MLGEAAYPARRSALGPGCVKTPVPRPSAQYLNPEGSVGDSLLWRRPNSRLNISFRSPQNSFGSSHELVHVSIGIEGRKRPNIRHIPELKSPFLLDEQ